ncbi:hypothetical protein NLI96_g807 [Meripilus lineatus]|uniref:Uncharacterized protein n=1 Tax=Meripilus lineatus TaxID=2056292 RepID=A0AAD5VFX3_9APHY|nr:hypothetical protein NLI96_g807 [Physisporinus lineatus]
MPLRTTELRSLKSVVETLDSRLPGSTYSIARLMSLLRRIWVHSKMMDSRESTDVPNRLASFTFHVASAAMFGSPRRYWKNMKDVNSDSPVHLPSWDRFVQVAREDWENSKLPSTVLLTTNIGFLAIPDITNSTVATVCSVVSMALCVSSFVTAHTSLRDFHQNDGHDQESITFFLRRTRSRWMGLRIVPLRFSLPNGLLIWSMISFMTGASSLFYEQSSRRTRIITGVVLLMITIFVLIVVNLDHPGVNSIPSPRREASIDQKRTPRSKTWDSTPLEVASSSWSNWRCSSTISPTRISSMELPRQPEKMFDPENILFS